MKASSGRRRVCLITPGHLATNPRLVKEADALAAAGFDVSVVAGSFIDWAREADREFVDRPWRIATTIAFGTSAPNAARQKQRLRLRSARLARRLGMQSIDVALAGLHPIGPDLMRAASEVRADLYVAHYVAALPAAAHAARRHGALYAFDAEDFHTGDLPDLPEHADERGMIREIEARFLPAAAHVTAAAPGIASAYAALYGIAPPTTVLNVFPAADAPAQPSAHGTSDRRPSLYWFSQTIGADRGLETAVAAIAIAKCRPHLHMRGRPADGYFEALQALAERHGVRDRLHLHPIAAPGELVRDAARFDVGLVGETGWTESRRVALTNKQFTYVLAGVPSLLSDIPAHRDIARGLAPAFNLFKVGDAQSLADRLDDLLLDPAALAAARAAAFRLGRERFNWERESLKLVSRVQETLERRQSPLAAQA